MIAVHHARASEIRVAEGFKVVMVAEIGDLLYGPTRLQTYTPYERVESPFPGTPLFVFDTLLNAQEWLIGSTQIWRGTYAPYDPEILRAVLVTVPTNPHSLCEWWRGTPNSRFAREEAPPPVGTRLARWFYMRERVA